MDWTGLEAPYDMVVADPPWNFRNWSTKGEVKHANRHYSCMSLGDIEALPVGDLAGKNCLLMLWTTNPMIDRGLEVMRAWGFTFKTTMTWRKITRRGAVAFGTGYILRGASEPILIGTRGSVKTTRSVRSIFDGVVREHSRKPDEFYREAERLMPSARRADLFARENRPGWDAWGDEVGVFTA